MIRPKTLKILAYSVRSDITCEGLVAESSLVLVELGLDLVLQAVLLLGGVGRPCRRLVR